jgi:hypothetical protein
VEGTVPVKAVKSASRRDAEKDCNLGEGVASSKAMFFTTELTEDTEKGQIRGEEQVL